MSDYSGSYRRFSPSENIPSYRPQNRNLGSLLVAESETTSHIRHGRNAEDRTSNKYADDTEKHTDFGREENLALGGGFGSSLASGLMTILPFIL